MRVHVTVQVDQSQQHPHMDGANLKIIWRQVTSIIISVCQQSQARPFLQPVDTARVKDYLDHVARPMDLGTIKKKLAAKAYGSPGQVLADVRLVFANCRAYNPPTEMVCKQGQELSEQFEHLWDKYSIDKRWQQLLDGVSGTHCCWHEVHALCLCPHLTLERLTLVDCCARHVTCPLYVKLTRPVRCHSCDRTPNP